MTTEWTAPMWLDVESGTYFGTPPLKINASSWSDDDWLAWHEHMSDADRTAWAENYLETSIPMPPSTWCTKPISEEEWWETIK
jgi:hypothetical protein